jgi:hypothetical protein
MKLTTARLLELAELGLSDTALRVYLTAHARIAETGIQDLSEAVLMNLPGLPRNPKVLGKAIVELHGKGLVLALDDGVATFPIPTSDVAAKRAAAGRLGGLAKASKRVASASGVPPSLLGGLPEQLPAASQADATDPSSPLVLSSPDSLSSPLSASSLFQPDFCSESSGTRPESKPARGAKSGARQRFVPDDWKVKARHRELASELRADLAGEEMKFREHEFKDPKQDFDRAFSRWLRRSVEFKATGVRASPGGGSTVPMLMARVQRLEAEGEGS